MKKKIPCKNCISYAMCVNKDEVRCSIIYSKVVYKDKKILRLIEGGVLFLFDVAHYLGHTDWTVYTIKQTVRMYTSKRKGIQAIV